MNPIIICTNVHHHLGCAPTTAAMISLAIVLGAILMLLFLIAGKP